MKGYLAAVRGGSRALAALAGAALTFLMLLTMADVVLRLFGRPIVGTYELVAMSGAVAVGLSMPLTSWMRGHIYVDSFVSRLPRVPRAIFTVTTRLMVLALFFVIGWNLVKYGMDLKAAGEVSPTLRIPFYPVTLGVGVSCFLQCLVLVGVIGLAALLLLFLTGIELGFAMAIVGFVGFGLVVSFPAAMNLMAKDVYDVFSSYGFTVIPLFILMGQVAYTAGIAKRLFDSSYKFIGHIPGGLALATVAGATAFKAICGSSPATAATFAAVAVPEMDRYGYDKRLSTGVVASVGTLGILIPPSVTLIVFGIITEQSIGKLFLAGILPGLLIACFFALTILVWCSANPRLGPKGERATWKDRIASLPDLVWVLLVFVIIVGGLMKGFFTPTEAGSVGTFAVILLSAAQRGLGIKGFVKSLSESLRTACMVLMLIAGSTILGHFLAVTRIPMIASEWVVSLPVSRTLVMVLVCVIYLVGGSFLDDLAFMILATPIFFPAVVKLGFDPLWFGMLIAVTVMIGVVIPPVAMNVFVVKNITKVPFGTIYKGVAPFLVSLVLAAALLFLVPQLATFLPALLMK
jgi:C4-dicarboxylate transporter DctM subunit